MNQDKKKGAVIRRSGSAQQEKKKCIGRIGPRNTKIIEKHNEKEVPRSTCDKLNKRPDELSGRGEVHQVENCSSEIHAKSEAVRDTRSTGTPKIRISTAPYVQR